MGRFFEFLAPGTDPRWLQEEPAPPLAPRPTFPRGDRQGFAGAATISHTQRPLPRPPTNVISVAQNSALPRARSLQLSPCQSSKHPAGARPSGLRLRVAAVSGGQGIPRLSGSQCPAAEGEADPLFLKKLLPLVSDCLGRGLAEIDIKGWVLGDQGLVSLGTILLQGSILTLEHLKTLEGQLPIARLMVRSISSGNYPLAISKSAELMKSDRVSFRNFLDGELARLCYQGRRSTVRTLNSTRADIEKRIGTAEKWKEVCKVSSIVAILLLLGLTVPVFVIGAPPKATFAIAAAALISKSAEQWVDQYWADRLKKLEEEDGIVAAMMNKNLQDYPLAKVEATVRELVEHGVGPFWATVRQLDSRMKVEREEEEMANLESMMRQMVPEMEKGIHGMEAKIGACRDEIVKGVDDFRRLIAKRTG